MFRALKKPALLGVVAVLALAGCGSGERNDGGATGGQTQAANSIDCEGEQPEATEIGVTESTIVVQVSADTGAPQAPGLASGSVEAVQAWAAEVNSNGGLACREVEVITYDSKMDPTESRNAMVASCEQAFASVGDTMLAAADSTPLVECTDMAGDTTGQPQIQTFGLYATQYCTDTTYFLFGPSGDPCPAQTGTRELTGSTAISDYMEDVMGGESHGLFGLSADSVGTLATSVAAFRVMADDGMAIDDIIGVKSGDTSAEYTPRATTIKDKGSQFVMWGAPFAGLIQLRQEAAVQGVDSVEHWVCTSCYDPAFVDAAGDVGPGTVVPIPHLPFEEADLNPEMQTFFDASDTHNLFAVLSWADGRLFEQAVNQIVEADGVNGLTRAALIEQLDSIKDFTNEGMIARVTPSERQATVCNVFVELGDDGTWARTFPTEEGEFHCGDLESVTIDPSTAFQG